MRPGLRSFVRWALTLIAIVTAGLLFRLIQTGFLLFDKYLGDALYAAMVYVILRPFLKPSSTAASAMAVMTAIELFQLTRIPAHLLASEHGLVHIAARLLGTQFSFLDLLAYASGIACVYVVDENRTRRRAMRRP